MSESKYSAQKLRASTKYAKALELRRNGFTYAQIGDALGVSKQNAYKTVQKALNQDIAMSSEDREQVRKLELDRCDYMQQAHWDKAMAGDEGKTLIILKIMERRAKLLGLDAPVKSDGVIRLIDETSKNLTDEEIEARINETA